ncbi:MAG: polyisoprenoid-binding protein [Simplicispira suum]|uniref:YceI family protein n=1 Tax=Simplicispira suum TaxID=2109915 RepID=UPI001C6B8A1D|nr:YceI family protein [Simplicispira suum]MBW7834914.1 polyisoprenoid-binding protein [Simplicispira suum]
MRLAYAAALLVTAGPALATQYEIDHHHTYVAFEIGHFGTSTNRAQFEKTSGSIDFDRAAKKGKVDVRVDTTSVHSGSAEFDTHLQGTDLFNTARYPEMRFVSDRFEFNGDRVAKVHGQLTLLGKTGPLVLSATQFNCYQSPILKSEVCGGDFEGSIDRTQWGMDYLVTMGMPKQVRLVVQIEAAKR